MIPKKLMRKTNSWWRNKLVLTTKPIANRLGAIPIGTPCKVTRKYGGLHLRTDPCPHCGIVFHVTHVAYSSLMLIDESNMVSDPHDAMERVQAKGNGKVVKYDNVYLVLPYNMETPLQTLYYQDVTDLAGRKEM